MNKKTLVLQLISIDLLNIISYIFFGLNASTNIAQVIFAIAITVTALDLALSFITGSFSLIINERWSKVKRLIGVICLALMMITMLLYDMQYTIYAVLGMSTLLLSSQIECDVIYAQKINQE